MAETVPAGLGMNNYAGPSPQPIAVPDRRHGRELVLWFTAVAPMILLFCHATAILPLMWERRPLSQVTPGGGQLYSVPLSSRWMSQEITGDSPAQLLEDGRPLPVPNADLQQIGRQGSGRYALRWGALYFSTSDNSDPRVNGRHYELLWPTEPPPLIMGLVVLLAAAGTLRALVVNRVWLTRMASRPPFWLSAAIYLSIVLLGRLWFLLDFRVPGLYGDSRSYYELVRTINEGDWPEFGIRTPGYPLLLKTILSVSDTVFAVVLVQNLLTATASLTLAYAFHSYRRVLSLWAATGMAVYTVGIWIFDHDTALLSDGPYAQSIIFAMAFLLLGLVRRVPLFFFLSSASMAAAILFRPAGLFLLVIAAACLVYLWWNRFGGRSIAAMAIPLPAMLLALATYNYSTLGIFALTAFGESQIAFSTFTFWEEDRAYPANVNEAIRRTQDVMRRLVTDDERRLLQTSWHLPTLAPIFLDGFHYPALDQASTLNGRNDYMGARYWVQRVSLDSIAKHPQLYAKFVITQLWLQYFANPKYQEDFITVTRNRIHDIYVSGRFERGKAQPFYEEMAKEWADKPAMPGFTVIGTGDEAEIVVRHTSVSRKLNRYLVLVRSTVFGNVFWTWSYFVALCLAPVMLWRSRGRHAGAFMTVVLTLTVLGASLVVALVEYGSHRYSAVVEFVYFLPILPLLFVQPKAAGA